MTPKRKDNILPNGIDRLAAARTVPSGPRAPESFDKVATGGYFDGEMRIVGIKTLKDKLSEYVRLAAGGETVMISDRDRIVAEMGPPAPGRAPEVSDAALAEAIREGLVSPATSPPGRPVLRAPAEERLPLERLLADLSRDRAER